MEAYNPPALVDASPSVAAAVITLLTLALVVFPLRIYVRLDNAAWGLDDTLMAIAAVPFVGLTIACLGGAFHGIGVHQERLNDAQITTGLMWFFLFEIFYCISIICIKLSITFMLIRVAGPMHKYVYSLYVCAALFTTMNLISLFYIIFQCKPVSFAWDTSTPGGSCNPSIILADIYYADTAVNIITDWYCALLPIPLLWNIQLNMNAKLSVAALLSMGVLASISACIRLKYTVNLNDSTEYLHSVGDIVIWGYAENGVGFCVGCISTLRPLFRRVFNLGSSSRGQSDVHPYSRNDVIEFNAYIGPKEAKHTTTINTSTGARRRNSAVYDSGSESEEQLVKDNGSHGTGIQVSKSIRQHRE